ncbi:hypothetical protein LTR62_007894 [Meristemomyces frigidus]|uniref:Uncharacterized protein n=1 Tax=Meristemomyces frigidus TaxID=1508187 RepID=A0AAN7TA98_9PEZI|nr:hypothetical protein LTR62_007894 [Meristemomyces frigidus]
MEMAKAMLHTIVARLRQVPWAQFITPSGSGAAGLPLPVVYIATKTTPSCSGLACPPLEGLESSGEHFASPAELRMLVLLSLVLFLSLGYVMASNRWIPTMHHSTPPAAPLPRSLFIGTAMRQTRTRSLWDRISADRSRLCQLSADLIETKLRASVVSALCNLQSDKVMEVKNQLRAALAQVALALPENGRRALANAATDRVAAVFARAEKAKLERLVTSLEAEIRTLREAATAAPQPPPPPADDSLISRADHELEVKRVIQLHDQETRDRLYAKRARSGKVVHEKLKKQMEAGLRAGLVAAGLADDGPAFRAATLAADAERLVQGAQMHPLPTTIVGSFREWVYLWTLDPNSGRQINA